MSIRTALQESVLVLNANYEPLGVCSMRRAITMVFTDKADTVLLGNKKIHTVSTSFETPSIIRLRKMIKRPRPRIHLSKRELLKRDNHTCQYCGKKGKMTIDHVIPKSKGGVHAWSNVVAACDPCNHKKGGKLLERVNMKLRTEPKEPRPSALYRFNTYLNRYNEWEQFIQGW